MAQNQVLDGVKADHAQAKGLTHTGVNLLEAERLEEAKHLDVLAPSGACHARLEQAPEGGEVFGQLPARKRRRLVEGAGLVLDERQVMEWIEDELLALVGACVARDHLRTAADDHLVHVAADQHLAVSFSEDAPGSAWGEARRIPLPQDGPLWSPVLHTDSRGRLWLFYAESNECRITSTPPRYSPGGSVKAAVYGLGGQARWSKPREIYGEEDGDGLPKVLANKLIVLSTGEWVLPVWSEKHGT